MKKKDIEISEKTKTSSMVFSIAKKGKGILSAKESLNCICTNGAIRALPGCAYMLNDNSSIIHQGQASLLDVLLIRRYREAYLDYARRLLYIGSDGTVYLQSAEGSGYTYLNSVGVRGASFSFLDANGRMWGCVFGAGKLVVIDDMFTCTVLGFGVRYGAGCYYKNRLFVGINPSTVVYSAPESPTDFNKTVNGSGEIRFSQFYGEVLAMIPFREALYVFFEHGIARIDVVGSPKEFKVTHIPYTGGTILFRTVGACESAVYFLTAEGLYRFDGEKAECILQNVIVPPISTMGREKVVAWNDGVFIRYRKKTGSDALLWVKGDGEECAYLEDINAMSPDGLDGVLMRTAANVIGKLDVNGSDLGRIHRFYAETDFELHGRKTLRKLTFEGEGAFVLTLKNGCRRLSRNMSFEKGVATVNLSERGDRYAITLELSVKTTIRNMTAELRILDS